jgi:TolB-like protein
MRVFIWAVLCLAPLLVRVEPAAAKGATVAVMPFRDLSGGSKFVGEAIRETVTSDLKQLGSLRVVERGSLDKILSEQGLQAQQQDLDLPTAVKIGKVLGASLIVIGAYQKLTPQVRLTARFVKVETSEIIGTAKVDGGIREFLRLQDRVTAALLRSAGFAVHAKRVLDDSERRPELSNFQTLELYGQAVTSDNDMMRRQYLAAAVAADNNFSYAVKDLEALEKRIAEYQATSLAMKEKELQLIEEKLRTTTDRTGIAELTYKRIVILFGLRRHHAVAREVRTFFEGLPTGATIDKWVEGIALFMVQADLIVRDREALLRDGEQYLQRAPGATNFGAVKQIVEQAITQKRQLVDKQKKSEEELATLSHSQRWDLCMVAMRYSVHEQYDEAKRLFQACFKVGTHKPDEYFDRMAMGAYMAGDWKGLKKVLVEWAQVDAKKAKEWKQGIEHGIPADE